MRRVQQILLTAALLFPLQCFAESVTQLHPTNYVNDFAQVINAQTAAELNDVCQQLDEKAHAKVAVVTINTLDGRDIESYAVELFKQWGIGSKGSNRGVLILLAVRDHKYRTEVGYGLEPILPDGKVGGFGREAVPLLKQDDYRGAVRLMTLRVADVIAQDAGVQLTGEQAPAPVSEQPLPHISLVKVVFFVIIVIIVLATPPLRKVLFWWLLFNSGPRWGGGYRSGGWGGGGFGGGGGGGFGGFGGGGMSGGGGASGSW